MKAQDLIRQLQMVDDDQNREVVLYYNNQKLNIDMISMAFDDSNHGCVNALDLKGRP